MINVFLPSIFTFKLAGAVADKLQCVQPLSTFQTTNITDASPQPERGIFRANGRFNAEASLNRMTIAFAL